MFTKLRKNPLVDLVGDTVKDGMTVAVGGFGLSGNPFDLIEALRDTGRKNLTIVSNNMGVDGLGLGVLLENNQVDKVCASYVGENSLFAQQYLSGELEVEFNPQGTLAERLRAGGAGIPAFFTPAGVGTPIAEGKTTMRFDGRDYLMERAIIADVALVHAAIGDDTGNLRYRLAARNFNPVCAESGVITIAQVEKLVHPGELHPDDIMTPGVHIDHLVIATDREKPIENRTVRKTGEQQP